MSEPAGNDSAEILDGSGDDRLLTLFSNRTALKKAHRELLVEHRLLEERLHDANAETDALKTKVDYLESKLSDRDGAPGLMLHYQLRGLREQLIAAMTEVIKRSVEAMYAQHREQAEREWRDSHAGNLSRIAGKIAAEQAQRDRTRGEITTQRSALAAHKAPWWYWRRKTIRAAIESLRRELDARSDALDALLAHHHSIEQQTPPSIADVLSTREKREVNVMALLVYREFLDCYEGDTYIERIKMACKREPGAIDYGKVEKATSILQDLADKADAWLERVTANLNGDALDRAAQPLLRIAQYDAEKDTTPCDFLGSFDSRSTGGTGEFVRQYSDALLLREDPLRLRDLLLR
ncbi:MAG: hypothetical protein AAAFM81_07395 [Pseudomonadota bacterium]